MPTTNDANDNIYKILGAVALINQDGAVDRIDPSILRQGDACFCITSTGYYVFRAYESAVEPTPEPFSAKNPPLIIRPDVKLFGNTSTFRWHLVSSPVNATDLIMSSGTKIVVGKLQGDPALGFYNGEGIKVAEVKADGSFWVSKLVTSSKDLVDNLNAKFLQGHTEDEFIYRDGSKAFTNPVAGVNPTEPAHLTTKNYVDESVQILQPALYVKRDGSAGFQAPVSGFDPVLPDHLATKRYVDESLESTINKLYDMQRFIIYKTGTSLIPVGSRKITVNFGGSLSRYAVFATVVNTTEPSPVSTTAVISEQYTTFFTADLGGTIPTANYKLNWLIVGIPDGTENLPSASENPETPSTLPAASTGSSKTVLQENTNVYLSGGMGLDSNDGFTRFSPKKTVAGLITLLNSIDTNGFKVKVNVLTPLDEIESLWFLPNYSVENLEITNDSDLQGITFPSTVNIVSGGCKFTNVSFKTLSIFENAAVTCSNISISPENQASGFTVKGSLKLENAINLVTKTYSFAHVTGDLQFSETRVIGTGSLEVFLDINGGHVNFSNFSNEKVTANLSAILQNGGSVSGLKETFPGKGKTTSLELAKAAIAPDSWKHATQHSKNGIDPITPESIGALGIDGTAKTAEKWKNDLRVELTGAISGSAAINASEKTVNISTVLSTTDPTIEGLINYVNSHKSSVKPTGQTIIMRSASGTAQVAPGVKPEDIIVKQQLDDLEKKLTEQDAEVLNAAIDAGLKQAHGIGEDSFWSITGNLLICWGKAIFHSGIAEVKLPNKFKSINYIVTFGANESSSETLTFTVTSKETQAFTAMCSPNISAEQSYIALGLTYNGIL